MIHVSFDEIKRQAAGRWQDILPALTPLSGDVLRKAGDDHPCPLCNSKSTIWPADDAEQSGRIACRKCTDNRPTGDGIATVAAFAGCTQGDAAKRIAEYLGIQPRSESDGPPVGPDVIDQVCRDKKMPREAFLQFGAVIETRGRGKQPCARVPIYDETGQVHSHFDFVAGHKGFFARGVGMSGLFLPGRLPAEGETWLMVEGVKDAAALVGLGFNACGLPTSYLADKYAGLFRGVDVVLVPDLDQVGQDGAQHSGGNLKGIAASVHMVRLPGEITATKGEDVRDVLARPDGAKLVRDAITAAEPWTPREGEHDPKDGRPEVLLTLAYGWATDQVTGHIGRLGWASPWIPTAKRERLKLYHRGGSLVHVVTEADPAALPGGVTAPGGTARIRPLPIGQLPLRIADAAQLMIERMTPEGPERVATPPPRWLVDGIFTRGEYGADLKRLEAIITAPTLRADGTIVQRPGYDDKTGLLHIPGGTFPTVPSNPTHGDAKRAAAELLEVVADFEFVSDSDRAAWLALVLSQIGRQAVAGCVPLFGITATTRGSGKSLLADAASLIAFGRPAARKPYSPDDDEQRKAITATALEALPAVLLDNVDRVLGGASLDAALTALTWSDRVLGASKTTGDLPLRTVWSATGNNLRFGSDLARRVLPIRLAPTVENPEERTDFAHTDLLGWVRQNRPRLAVAALTILRAYFVAERPEQPGGTWGSFEAWSALVRGSIVWTGLADPLTTRETAKADDTSGAVVRGLIGGLLEVDEHGDGLTVREIVAALEAPENAPRYPAMREAISEVATHRGMIDQRRLTYAFRKYKGRIGNGWQIVGESARGGVIRWAAKRISGDHGDHGYHANPDPYAGGVCVPHVDAHTHERTHTGPHGEPGESWSLSSPWSPLPTTVVHLNREAFDVRIDRKSKWGNPFVIGTDGDRAEVIAKYRAWVVEQPELMAALGELRGKRLGCWCAPEACHGDVLAELADRVPEGPKPVTDGRPCPRCGHRPMVQAEPVNGWVNFDCPRCKHVKPVRVSEGVEA